MARASAFPVRFWTRSVKLFLNEATLRAPTEAHILPTDAQLLDRVVDTLGTGQVRIDRSCYRAVVDECIQCHIWHGRHSIRADERVDVEGVWV